MSYDKIYDIASQGMRIEKMRIDTVANNIANQYTISNSDGSTFQPMHVEARTVPFEQLIESTEQTPLNTAELVANHLPPNKVYQPGHPKADDKGYVTYPGISTIDEMTTLLRASRGYEANIKVINTAHNLYLQALTIGEER
jgi:flagellar basal-body rod protein FlgC